MREIKFRAKAIHNNKWVYGSYFEHINRQICPFGDSLKDEDIEPIIIQDSFADWNMPTTLQRVDVDKNTVGQYTGLKDKNGVEIYEGDIVKVFEKRGKLRKKTSGDYYDRIHNLIYVVKFGAYKQDGSGSEYEPTECYGWHIEVSDACKDYFYTDEHFISILQIEGEVIGNIYENKELLEAEV